MVYVVTITKMIEDVQNGGMMKIKEIYYGRDNTIRLRKNITV